MFIFLLIIQYILAVNSLENKTKNVDRSKTIVITNEFTSPLKNLYNDQEKR